MAELPVPPHYRSAAEAVVAHLCLLRGGAPFLSPMDAWQLVCWFDAGVTAQDLAVALERAAAARRKERGKRPLGLGAAKRHLGKPAPAGVRAAAPAEGPWGPLFDGLADADALREALAGVDPAAPGGEDAATAAVRDWLAARWDAQGEPAREALRERARAELADLLTLLDAETGRELVEETARDLFRQRYPTLGAAAVRALARPA